MTEAGWTAFLCGVITFASCTKVEILFSPLVKAAIRRDVGVS